MPIVDVDLLIADDVENDDDMVDYNNISFSLRQRGCTRHGCVWTISHNMTFRELRVFCARVLHIPLEDMASVRVWCGGKLLADNDDLVRRIPRGE